MILSTSLSTNETVRWARLRVKKDCLREQVEVVAVVGVPMVGKILFSKIVGRDRSGLVVVVVEMRPRHIVSGLAKRDGTLFLIKCGP